MAVMNTRSTVPSGALPGNSNTGGPAGVLAGGSVGQAGVMSGQPGAGNMVSLQTPHQPAGSKPGTQTPPANVLQVVKQVGQENWLRT
jgi:E1A/CREB-binding protein